MEINQIEELPLPPEVSKTGQPILMKPENPKAFITSLKSVNQEQRKTSLKVLKKILTSQKRKLKF